MTSLDTHHTQPLVLSLFLDFGRRSAQKQLVFQANHLGGYLGHERPEKLINIMKYGSNKIENDSK